MKKIMFVLTILAFVLSGCAPTAPHGTLIVEDGYQSKNIFSLNVEGSPSLTVTPFNRGSDQFLGQDGKYSIFAHYDFKGDLYFKKVILGGNEAPIDIHVPGLVQHDWSDYTWEKGYDGKWYLGIRKFDFDTEISSFKVFRLDVDKFTHIRDVNFDKAYYYGRGPTHTPDFAKIIIEDTTDGRSYLYNSDTKEMILFPLQGDFSFPSFSPDGTNLIYLTLLNNKQSRCLVTMPTQNMMDQTVLHCVPWNAYNYNSDVAWSPDGKYLAINFNNYRTKKNELEVFEAKSHKLVSDTFLVGDVYDITWSPDSQYIAFYADPNNDPGLYTMEIMTSKLEKIYSQPNWKDIYRQSGGIFPFQIDGWIQ